MTLILELDAETEARLKAQAKVHDLAVEAFAEWVLRKTEMPQEAVKGRPTAESLEATFIALAEGSENRPILPPEAFERASFSRFPRIRRRFRASPISRKSHAGGNLRIQSV